MTESYFGFGLMTYLEIKNQNELKRDYNSVNKNNFQFEALEDGHCKVLTRRHRFILPQFGKVNLIGNSR